MTANPQSPWFTRFPEVIERLWSRADAWWSGTATVGRFHNRSLFAFFLPVPVFVFAVYGPSFFSEGGGAMFRGGWWPGLLLIAALAVQLAYFLDRLPVRRVMEWLQFGLLGGLTLATFFPASPTAIEASADLYRSYYGWLATGALFVAVVLGKLVRELRWFQPPNAELEVLRASCDLSQLLGRTPRPTAGLLDMSGAAVIALLRTPLHVITPVAIYALLVPPAWLTWWCLVIVGLLSLALFAASNYDPSQDAFVRSFRRTFLNGGSLIVTVVVIAFAVLRVANVDYVTTVLNADVKSTVFSYLISTYAVFWLYDFWVQQEMILILGDLRLFAASSSHCTLRLHGSGRILIQNGTHRTGLMLEPGEFLRRIAEAGAADQRPALHQAALRVQQRLRAYMLLCGFLFCLVFGVAAWQIHGLAQTPGITVVTQAPPAGHGTFDLAEQLMSTEKKSVVMLAASGGGTRAAVYAAAVLHGLQARGRLDQLIVGSGVSGGSAALAYYAAHRGDLHDDRAPWARMREQLAFPFIKEVLAGCGEWRIATDSRAGTLLSESFERNMGPAVLLGSIKDLGLIFNTSLCGIQTCSNASKAQAGGRVSITNMLTTFDAATDPLIRDLDMPYHAVWAPTGSVFAAASLSANFPPVFSNAAVEVEGKQLRYWVTDGGGVENRGELSILLVLAEALAKIKAGGKPVTLPDITVIAADASAFDDDYQSDRGVGAALGAATQLTKRLVRELHGRIDELFAAVTGDQDRQVHFVELPMPDAFCVKGAFGTHWMMPEWIALQDEPARAGTESAIEMSKATALTLIDAMCLQDFSIDTLKKDFPQLTEPKRVVDAAAKLRQAWEKL